MLPAPVDEAPRRRVRAGPRRRRGVEALNQGVAIAGVAAAILAGMVLVQAGLGMGTRAQDAAAAADAAFVLDEARLDAGPGGDAGTADGADPGAGALLVLTGRLDGAAGNLSVLWRGLGGAAVSVGDAVVAPDGTVVVSLPVADVGPPSAPVQGRLELRGDSGLLGAWDVLAPRSGAAQAVQVVAAPTMPFG